MNALKNLAGLFIALAVVVTVSLIATKWIDANAGSAELNRVDNIAKIAEAREMRGW